VKFDLSGRAERDVERIGKWWQKHRDVGAALFFEELEEAEKHLNANPESGQPWRRRKGHLIRRWQLERTHYHVYYVYRPADEQIWVLTVWGSARREPKL
jgi:plasmid stabilization system protein ParE